MATVSIITPVFGEQPKNFNRLAKSIYEQTNRDFEWVVVHDDSNWLADTYGVPMKESCLGNNYGPGTARNVGFLLSDGDIITYVDADDELSTTRVEHLIDLYTRYNDIELCFDDYTIQDLDGNIYRPQLLKWLSNNPDYNLKDLLQHNNVSIPLGVSHLRKIFMDSGMFQRGIVCGEDGILWRRMSERLAPDHILITDSVAGIYYVNARGQSRTQRRFDEGGFAFNALDESGSHGQYLDKNWFNSFNSKELFDR